MATRTDQRARWADIELEVNAYTDNDPSVFKGKTILLPCGDDESSNFTKFFATRIRHYGIDKIIATDYAQDGNQGKALVINSNMVDADGDINLDDFEWKYLDGDGDFRSEEVTELRDEADIVITFPPASLLAEFIQWAIDGGVQFLVLGTMNTATCREVFPFFKSGKVWCGSTINSSGMKLLVPESIEHVNAGNNGGNGANNFITAQQMRWFTNIEHYSRGEELRMMSMSDNQRFNKKIVNNEHSYARYDNCDAIEVPAVEGIPSDYKGAMGVPIAFLDRHNTAQFEIIGHSSELAEPINIDGKDRIGRLYINGASKHDRIIIKNKKPDYSV